MKIKRLIKKFIRVWHQSGFLTAIGRSIHFVGNVEGRRDRRQDIQYVRTHKGKVLFINGCCVEHPTRYRVFHQMEQLKEAGISCAKIYFEDIDLRMEDNYQMFIFFRCECTDDVEAFIRKAKSHNKTVCFDVDDLVTDTKYTDQVPFVQELGSDDRKLFDESVMRTGKTLRMCDIAKTTKEALAEELGKETPETYINRNTASKEMVLCAESAYQTVKRDPERVLLGYFSGSLTHNKDFEVIRPALMRIMDEYPQVGLILVGELDAADELKKYSDRIIKKKATDWRNLPQLIALADVNLAPLENTLFNRAKSEIKWIEAALVRVPTVASKVGAFERMIENNVTGVLCEDKEDEWTESLKRLVEDRSLRERLGQQAYEFVMENCTTVAKATEYGKFVESNYTMRNKEKYV